jgi:prepilin-type processing-associated H-X9-DG protein
MYLLKYFSKKDYVDLGGQRLYSYVNTPLWGCPAVDKDNFDVSPTLSSADFNSGYGMGPYAAYTERTFINVNANPAWAMIQSSTGLAGKYYKQSQWTKPAERGIICDGRSWFLETRSPGVGANVPVPPQLGNWAIGYNASAIDQFDRYRHGHRADRVAMNMLYCDGHVETLADVKLAYIAIRRHWPG